VTSFLVFRLPPNNSYKNSKKNISSNNNDNNTTTTNNNNTKNNRSNNNNCSNNIIRYKSTLGSFFYPSLSVASKAAIGCSTKASKKMNPEKEAK
jgi:hypothetical protein